MCLIGVGKWMGAVFSEIGSAGRVLEPSGDPKNARCSSSSKGKNYRQASGLVTFLGRRGVSIDLVGHVKPAGKVRSKPVLMFWWALGRGEGTC